MSFIICRILCKERQTLKILFIETDCISFVTFPDLHFRKPKSNYEYTYPDSTQLSTRCSNESNHAHSKRENMQILHITISKRRALQTNQSSFINHDARKTLQFFSSTHTIGQIRLNRLKKYVIWRDWRGVINDLDSGFRVRLRSEGMPLAFAYIEVQHLHLVRAARRYGKDHPMAMNVS